MVHYIRSLCVTENTLKHRKLIILCSLAIRLLESDPCYQHSNNKVMQKPKISFMIVAVSISTRRIAMITPLGLDHIVLMTSDHGAMQDFYCRILGCSFEREQPKYNLLQLRAGDHLIDLIEDKSYQPPKTKNLAHFCIRIKEINFPELAEKMHSSGINLLRHGDRTSAKGTGPSCYLFDPENNEVELAIGAPSVLRKGLNG